MSDETKDAKRMPGSGDSGGADGKNGGNGGRAKGAGGKNNGGVDRIDAFAFARLGKGAGYGAAGAPDAFYRWAA